MAKVKVFLKIFGAILILLAAIELGIRAFNPKLRDNPFSPRIRNNLGLVPDAEILMKMTPNFSAQFKRKPENGGQVIDWQTDNDGLRMIGNKGDEKYRILLYGDSNFFGAFSEVDNSFAKVLKDKLEAVLKKGVAVFNSGIVGAGPDQFLIKFSKDIEKYQPNLIVLGIFADNDFGDLIRNRLFELAENGNFERTKPPERLDSYFYGMPEMASDNFWWRTLNSFAIVQYVYFYKRRNFPIKESIEFYLQENQKQLQLYQSKSELRYSHVLDHYDADLAMFPDSDSARLKRQLMNGVLAGFANLSKQKNVPVLVIVEPSSRDLTKNLSPNFQNFSAFLGYKPENMSSFVQQSCEAAQLPYINLFSDFQKNDPSSLYFIENDDHWNDRGQKLAAELTAKKILRMKVLFN